MSVFRLSENCWRVDTADHATILVDCADFYRAIHQSIVQARHSIFILGWEIDSGTRLLRGEDERSSPYPSVAVDLMAWKALQNPSIQIYLLRWDESIAFAHERELATELSWTARTPDNVHMVLDNTSPFGGSQHQKIVLIDDEIVFTGGMDIARQRWDEREHRIFESERSDALGSYGPYHDAQILMSGQIVQHFCELVRERWKRAAGYELPRANVAFSKKPRWWFKGRPLSWPDRFEPKFKNIEVGIARTRPKSNGQEGIHEVRQMYLDLIATAKRFIYIENQFFSSIEIAEALNKRLREKPKLKALLISSYDPAGILEREGMWAARIDFKKTVEKDLPPDQVRFRCVGIRATDGRMRYKRIHSKILIVDDHYLMVSSSNMSQRSLYLDTECDVVLQARTRQHARTIREIRDDLIREHTSRGYALYKFDDTKFTDQKLMPIALPLADPRGPWWSGDYPPHNPRKRVFIWLGFVLVLVLIA